MSMEAIDDGTAAPAPTLAAASTPPTVRRKRSRRSGKRRLLAVLAIMAFLFVVGVVVAVLTPYDPAAIGLDTRLADPSWAHPMGTDDLGRDVMTRLVVAGGVSLRAAAQAVAVAAALGIPAGLIAGYRGGLVDALLSRIVDALMSLPSLLVAMTVVAIIGPGLDNAMLAVGVAYSPQLFRVIRGVTIGVRSEEYVSFAEVSGASSGWIVTRHVLPNIVGHVLVNLSILAGFAILLESGLSFIGLGVQPPTPSWGMMLNRAYGHAYDQPITMVFPGVAIIVVVILFNRLADALRDTIFAPAGGDD